MTSIYNINPGFLQTYMTYQGRDKLDMEEVFKRLSFEMGGDGKTISKSQLDNYINNAESNGRNVGNTKLGALKFIQKNWDTIAKGEDVITYDNLKDSQNLLAATLTSDFTETEVDEAETSLTDAIYDYLTDYLGLSSKNDVTKTDLTSYLNELISEQSGDSDANNELIGALTNMIDSSSYPSTIEADA